MLPNMPTHNMIVNYPTVFNAAAEGGFSVRVPDVQAITQIDTMADVDIILDAVGTMLQDVAPENYPPASDIESIALEEWESAADTKVIMMSFDMDQYKATL